MTFIISLVLAGLCGYGAVKLFKNTGMSSLVRWPLMLLAGLMSFSFLITPFDGSTQNTSTHQTVKAHVVSHKTHTVAKPKKDDAAKRASESKANSESIAESQSESTAESLSLASSQSESIVESQSRESSRNESIATSQAAQQSRSAARAAARAAEQQQASTIDSNQGPVIGDIRSHIYHTPDQAVYHMNPANAVTFNSEQDAINAGYRKSLR